MKKLKVLHLCSSDMGGAFMIAQKISNELLLKGIESELIIYSGKNNNFKITGIKLLDNFIKFSLHAMEKFIFLFYEKDKKMRFTFSLGFPGIPYYYIKKKIVNCDIVHIHWINKGFVNVKDLTKFKKPIVWTTHDIWIATGGCHLSFDCDKFKIGCGNCFYLKNLNENDLSSKLYKTKLRIVEKLNVSFVSPSNWMLTNLKSSLITQNSNLINIPNGINVNIFHKQFIERENDVFNVGFVSANLSDSNKAMYRLIEALNLIHKSNKKININLVLIGKYKSENPIGCLFPITKIDFVSSQEEMSKMYNQIDLLSVTSTLETFPTTIIEAGCCGVPSIAFNVGGISDIITEEVGELIDPFDIEKYSEGILKILLSKDKYQFLDKFMLQKYGISSIVDNYIDLYKKMI